MLDAVPKTFHKRLPQLSGDYNPQPHNNNKHKPHNPQSNK